MNFSVNKIYTSVLFNTVNPQINTHASGNLSKITLEIINFILNNPLKLIWRQSEGNLEILTTLLIFHLMSKMAWCSAVGVV